MLLINQAKWQEQPDRYWHINDSMQELKGHFPEVGEILRSFDFLLRPVFDVTQLNHPILPWFVLPYIVALIFDSASKAEST